MDVRITFDPPVSHRKSTSRVLTLSHPVLGMSSWLNFGDRAATNEILTVFYFRSAVHLHHFARGPSHRAGWDWWNKMVKKHPYMGIMHEIYSVPKQRWENVYINYHPTGLCESQVIFSQFKH